MQDQPDQTTLSMGDDPDSLIMSEARGTTAVDNVEDTSFDFYGGTTYATMFALILCVLLIRSWRAQSAAPASNFWNRA